MKIIALLAVPMVFLTGCMSFNPKSLRQMETALQASNPDLRIESSMKFGFGPLTMDLVDFAFVHDGSIDVSKISRAEIGIYELGGTMVVNDFTMPQDFTADRSCQERQVIVRVMEDDEHMQVVACIRDEKVIGLAVFVLEPTEIVVINARGDFEGLINAMVRSSMNKKSSYSASSAAASINSWVSTPVQISGNS